MAISRPISRSISRPINRGLSSRFVVIPVDLFDLMADYPPGLILDFSDETKVVRTGRTVTSVLDSSGNSRTFSVIGAPQYYEEDNCIHLAPGQAIYRADGGFLNGGAGAVFAIFTLKSTSGTRIPIFAKYNTTGNQRSFSVSVSSTNHPQFLYSLTGAADDADLSLDDTLIPFDPTYFSFLSNTVENKLQLVVNAFQGEVSGTSAFFNSSAGYGVNYENGAASTGDLYLHYLMVYDDNSVTTAAALKIDGYLGYWYETNMIDRQPVIITQPTITGTPNNGYVLSIDTGLALRNPTISYQWTKNAVAIAGATYPSYLQVLGDVGATIGCTGYYYNADGSTPYTITGSVCGAAFGTPPYATAPVITTQATLSGYGLNAQTLTVTPAVTENNHPETRTYRWLVDAAPLFGAYGLTYNVSQRNEAKIIECIETIRNAYGTTESRTNSVYTWNPEENLVVAFESDVNAESKQVVLWYDANDYWQMRDQSNNVNGFMAFAEWLNKAGGYINGTNENAATQAVDADKPVLSHTGMNGMAECKFQEDGAGVKSKKLQMAMAIDLVDKTLFFVMRSGLFISGYLTDLETGDPDYNAPIFTTPLAGNMLSHTTDDVVIESLATTDGSIQFNAGTNNWVAPVTYAFGPEVDSNGVTQHGISLPHIYTWEFDTTLKLYVDGDLKATSATRTGTVATNINLIGVKGASTGYWSGSIGDIIVVNKILSAGERAMYEGYLAYKYGLSAKLPALHPLKSVAPDASGLNFSKPYNTQYLPFVF